MTTGGELREARARAKTLVDDLRDELEGIIAGQSDPPDDEHDVEGCSIAFERARVQALLTLAESRLAALDDAARDGSTVGVRTCETCGDPIAEERVAAVPGTRQCVRCSAATAAGGARRSGVAGRATSGGRRNRC